MLELLEKLDNLKQELDKLEIFKEIEELKEKIYSNQELMEKIKKYNEFPNNNLRSEIYKYEEIKKYKKVENQVNILIFEINKNLNKITMNRSCQNAYH